MSLSRRVATRSEHERLDDEASRLIHQSPKDKPPRKDLRRERVDVDGEKDPDEEQDRKDRSLNFKDIGGSLTQRVLCRWARSDDRVPARSKETGDVVYVSRKTLQEESGKYEEIKNKDRSETPEKPSEPSDEEPSESDSEPESESKSEGLDDEDQKAVDKVRKIWQEKSKGGDDKKYDLLLHILEMMEGGGKGSGEISRIDTDSENKEEGEIVSPEDESRSDNGESGKSTSESKSHREQTEAEKSGIPAPTRSAPTDAERDEAIRSIQETFPSNIASQIMSSDLHPQDVRQMVQTYSSVSKTPIEGNLRDYADKIRGLYHSSFSSVPPPSKWDREGKEVSFDSLSDSEKSEAYRQHQAQVVAVSMAAEAQIADRLKEFLGPLSNIAAEAMVRPGVDPEKTAEAVVNGLLRTGTRVSLTPREAKKLFRDLPAEAHPVVSAAVQVDAYDKARKELLGDRNSPHFISEHDSPKSIASNLFRAVQSIQTSGVEYGSPDMGVGYLFQQQVMRRLRELQPEKVAAVQESLDNQNADHFDRLESYYNRARARWERQKSKHDQKHPGKPFDTPSPNPPLKPPRYDSVRGPTSDQVSDVVRRFAFGRDFTYPPFRTVTLPRKQEKASVNAGSDFVSKSRIGVEYSTFIPTMSTGDQTMNKLSAAQSKNASSVLSSLDGMSGYLQNHYAGLGLNFETAKKIVNALDKCADDLEVGVFGPESFEHRKREVLAAALEIEPDEPYMNSFNSPQGPIQTDSDEPYMAEYQTDITTEVVEGEDETGRELAPEYK